MLTRGLFLIILGMSALAWADEIKLKPNERDLHQSPFQSIHVTDYSALAQEMNTAWGLPIFYNDPFDFPDAYRSLAEKNAWLTERAQKYPGLFQKLPITGTTSYQSYIDLVKQGDPEALKFQRSYPTPLDKLANKTIHEISVFMISTGNSAQKKNILIWAKEHADEFNTSEFVMNFSDVVLSALAGELDQKQPVLAETVKRIFAHANLIVIPDVTPDSNLETGVREDKNFIGQLLQPFDYDASSAVLFAATPEAKFLKQVIDSTPNVALGIDLHSPYQVSTVLVEADAIAENARYIVTESEYVKNCSAAIPGFVQGQRKEILCERGWVTTDQPGISDEDVVSASYLSRTHSAPGILLEIGGAKYGGYGIQKFNRAWDLRENTPYLLSAFELVALSPTVSR